MSRKPTFTSRDDWPTSLDEAVERLLAALSENEKQLLRSISKEEVIRFHHSWGAGIRNDFGLWSGNRALLRSCGETFPDQASLVIMEAVWQRVHDEG